VWNTSVGERFSTFFLTFFEILKVLKTGYSVFFTSRITRIHTCIYTTCVHMYHVHPGTQYIIISIITLNVNVFEYSTTCPFLLAPYYYQHAPQTPLTRHVVCRLRCCKKWPIATKLGPPIDS
jgi:hypothetical protein